jgi:hypothetical protein
VAHDEGPAEELAHSIRLGYEVEARDAARDVDPPSDDEVSWLAAWLVSEGWTRSPAWPHR